VALRFEYEFQPKMIKLLWFNRDLEKMMRFVIVYKKNLHQ